LRKGHVRNIHPAVLREIFCEVLRQKNKTK